MVEPKERLLRKMIPPGHLAVSASSYIVTGSGWELVTATNANGNPTHWMVWRGYFDLSGIVEAQETLFTLNPSFQEGGDFNYHTTNALGALGIYDMVTQEYITDETFDNINGGFGSWIVPGMIGGEGTLAGAGYELEDVHYGRARTFQFGPLTTLGVSPSHPFMTHSSSWGLGSATAGQKLYITRAIPLQSAFAEVDNLNLVGVPATAVIVPSVIVEEPDLMYIERLRRSYVVQGTID